MCVQVVISTADRESLTVHNILIGIYNGNIPTGRYRFY